MKKILKKNSSFLFSLPNVVATGIGYKVKGGKRTGEVCICVSVVKKGPQSLANTIPPRLNGIVTDVIQTGEFSIGVPQTADLTQKHRPAPGGVSIGHRDITAGTFGCVVKRNGQRMILSNNHVLANINKGIQGDPILQPGTADGGTDTDQLASLQDFIELKQLGDIDAPPELSDCIPTKVLVKTLNLIAKGLSSQTRLQAIRQFKPENLVDVAIALPLKDSDVLDSILIIGEPTGTAIGKLGMKVHKSGRTTGYQVGEIEQVDVEVMVNYGEFYVQFVDQLIVGPNSNDGFSAGGDSGSAVLDMDNNLVGLLFAGSGITTLLNRWEHVENLMGVVL